MVAVSETVARRRLVRGAAMVIVVPLALLAACSQQQPPPPAPEPVQASQALKAQSCHANARLRYGAGLSARPRHDSARVDLLGRDPLATATKATSINRSCRPRQG
jgi:hypothetical protein